MDVGIIYALIAHALMILTHQCELAIGRTKAEDTFIYAVTLPLLPKRDEVVVI